MVRLTFVPQVLTIPEQRKIPTMRNRVINLGAWLHVPVGRALIAEGLLAQYERPKRTPACRSIEPTHVVVRALLLVLAGMLRTAAFRHDVRTSGLRAVAQWRGDHQRLNPRKIASFTSSTTRAHGVPVTPNPAALNRAFASSCSASSCTSRSIERLSPA
jgi:hypothetical protein